MRRKSGDKAHKAFLSYRACRRHYASPFLAATEGPGGAQRLKSTALASFSAQLTVLGTIRRLQSSEPSLLRATDIHERNKETGRDSYGSSGLESELKTFRRSRSKVEVDNSESKATREALG